MGNYDLVIRGGTIIDGNGGDRYVGDVAVQGDRIAAVGVVDGTGTREIDATGLLVTPGFVDIHTHYDGQVSWDTHLTPSAYHGVTTVVMGNCGVGFAPVHDDDHQRLIELMEGVEDIPGTALDEGLTWKWNSFGDYLDEIDGRRFDIDVAAQVPHAALRLNVMGERGAQREAATADDIEHMAKLAAEAIEAGALGFSTSRTRNHKTSKGELTPTLDAEEAELAGIAAAIGKTGKGVLQLVSDFLDTDEEFAMLRRLVEDTGRPLSMTVIHVGVYGDQYRRLLDNLSAARADGLPMTGQVAARPIGVVLSLETTVNPLRMNPVWHGLAGLPLAEQAAALAGGEQRAQLLDAQRDGAQWLGTEYDRMFELGEQPNYEPRPEDSIAARAAAAGVDPHELALDLLLSDGTGKGMLFLPFSGFVEGNLDSTHEMLSHPHTVPGLSDGGAHVGTICDGSFPTTLLTHWGRDRDGDRIDVEYLIQQQCRDTARTVGLNDRGVLQPGHRADINLIDFEALAVHKPEIHWDLPAGGRRLMQRASGYRRTFVAGVETYVDGEPTGALPGRLVRGAQEPATP